MNRLCTLFFCAAFAAGCAEDAQTSPSPATGGTSLDPTLVLQSIVAHPPPRDGRYIVDASVVRVPPCGCLRRTPRCDCRADSVEVTNDLADSASWSLRVDGGAQFEYPFEVGRRYLLTVRIEHGEASVVEATAR